MYSQANQPVVGWLEGLWSPTHQGSNPGARIYSWISGDAHSVGGDVSVDDEMPTVTS